jgi:hypothetical protein
MGEERLIRVWIFRGKGKETDLQLTARFTPEEMETVKQTMALVNGVSRNQENWSLEIEGEEGILIPQVKL